MIETGSVKFDFKMTVDKGLQKVKDAVDNARAKSDFPELPVEPNIFEMDPSKMPIMNINLRGANASLLKEIAEEAITATLAISDYDTLLHGEQAKLCSKILADVQTAADKMKLGVKITFTGPISLSPPFDVIESL